jgi:nucleoside-diphosphate-sugar epimerase
LRGPVSNETALVTGASGLVGSAIVEALLEEGWRVLSCARLRPARERSGVTWVPYDLRATSLPPDFGAGADVLIHAALDTTPHGDAAGANVSGARLLLNAVRRNGVGRQIFISSFAAAADAPSAYGREKFEIEKLFDAPEDAVVRPGLVIGNGGLFGRLVEQLDRRGLVPLIDGGRQPMQTVLDEDLGRAIARVARRRLAGLFRIAEPLPVEYRTFWGEVAAQMNVPVRFLSMPFWLADLAARFAEHLPIGLPVNRERLLGLTAMRAQPVTTDEGVVAEGVRDYRESVRIALGKIAANRTSTSEPRSGAIC